jgi:uncharacterized protein (DUF4415 family)
MSEKRTSPESPEAWAMKNDEEQARMLADAEIEKAVADDPDTFVPDAKWFERARLVTPRAKEMVTLRLDPDVLAWFRKAGRGYQTRINAVLRAFVEAQDPSSR